ncbi:MAG TPA: enoyl-CoA hydratase-related protein [Dictyobacter sp.]|nr:enoyl-CoA hydratase-related protein [Dictyobacter sp.]
MTIVQHNEQGILTLTLNRPQTLNAITTEMLQELAQALQEAQATTVRTIIIAGAGRGFCSGQDLKEFQGKQIAYSEHLQLYNQIIKRIRKLPKPVIAALHGSAVGAGLSLALACDIRLAASDATFSTGFSRIALVPDSGMSYLLPRLVGWSKAFELVATSSTLSAQEALQLGIVNQVFDSSVFQEQVQSYSTQFAQGPTRALGLFKQALQKSFHSNLDEALAFEATLQDQAASSPDHNEGIRAFMEKRPPTFTGE